MLGISIISARDLWEPMPLLWNLYGALLHVSTCYCLPLLLPLCFYGGRFCGEKTALMRAAIEGDEEGVRRELEANPQVLHLRNKDGESARSYAEKSGHAALAEVLRGMEGGGEG